MPLYRTVDGVQVELTPEEEAEVLAEWAANTPTDEDRLNEYKNTTTQAVQKMINDTVKNYWYDSIDEVPQFSVVDNQWKNEATQILEWNASTWELVNTYYSNLTLETINPDFINTLPSLTLQS